MSKLENLAIRIGQISNEIQSLKDQREINLQHCHGSEDEDFSIKAPSDYNGSEPFNNCLYNAYEWVKADRESDDETCFSYTAFADVLNDYGCENCKGAHKAKQEIGKLKQERGRIIGNISIIGKSLRREN